MSLPTLLQLTLASLGTNYVSTFDDSAYVIAAHTGILYTSYLSTLDVIAYAIAVHTGVIGYSSYV